MTKTTEELYEERVEDATRGLLVEFLENQVDFLTVVEYLEEDGEDWEDDDFAGDVQESVNAALDTILQRWLDN